MKTDWTSMDVTVQVKKQGPTSCDLAAFKGSVIPPTDSELWMQKLNMIDFGILQVRSRLMCAFCEMVHIPKPITQKVI